MRWLFDPRILNFVILGLYALNMVRWAFAGIYVNALYWFGAFVITSAVTLGMKH